MTKTMRFSETMMTILLRQQRAFSKGRAQLEELQARGFTVQGEIGRGRVNVTWIGSDGQSVFRTFKRKDLVEA